MWGCECVLFPGLELKMTTPLIQFGVCTLCPPFCSTCTWKKKYEKMWCILCQPFHCTLMWRKKNEKQPIFLSCFEKTKIGKQDHFLFAFCKNITKIKHTYPFHFRVRSWKMMWEITKWCACITVSILVLPPPWKSEVLQWLIRLCSTCCSIIIMDNTLHSAVNGRTEHTNEFVCNDMQFIDLYVPSIITKTVFVIP